MLYEVITVSIPVSHRRSLMGEDVAWVPTYSGMIIFPDLGLGSFNFAKHTEKEFFESVITSYSIHYTKLYDSQSVTPSSQS